MSDVSRAPTAQPSTHTAPARTVVAPIADRLAAVLADADLRHRNPAAAQMIATTTVEQAEAVQAQQAPNAFARWGW